MDILMIFVMIISCIVKRIAIINISLFHDVTNKNTAIQIIHNLLNFYQIIISEKFTILELHLRPSPGLISRPSVPNLLGVSGQGAKHSAFQAKTKVCFRRRMEPSALCRALHGRLRLKMHCLLVCEKVRS